MSARAPPSVTDLLLTLADDELILGWRDSEWTGIAPFLEEDVAFSSIAQNEIGHARALYELAARELGTTADALAFDREPEEYRSARLVELRSSRLGAHDRAALPLRDGRRDPHRGAQGVGPTRVAGLAAEDRARGGVPPHARARCGPTQLARVRRGARAARAGVERALALRARLLDGEQRPLYRAAWRSASAIGLRRTPSRSSAAATPTSWPALWDEMTMVRRSAPGAQW